MNVPDKTTGGAAYEASEFNQFKNESQNAITKAGQTLNASDIEQLSKSLFASGVGASSMQDSGSANTCTLSPTTGVNGLVVPDSYSALNGAIFMFNKASPNTATNVIINVGQTGTELGAKILYRKDGTTPVYIGDVTGICSIQYFASIDAYILLSSGADEYPNIYSFYDQEPMVDTPANLFPGTTWENVSSRSVFYHLASTSGGAETDVVIRDLVEHNNGSGTWSIDKEYAFADLVYDDVIGGSGTHAGKYIIEVNNFSGMSKRYEGGYAEAFENGTLLNAAQRKTGEFNNGASVGLANGVSNIASGVFKNGAALGSGLNTTTTPSVNLGYDNAGQTGQTYNTSGDGLGNEGSNPGENRVDSYTIKKWRRTS